MKAYKVFRDKPWLVAEALTRFEQKWESVKVLGMNTVTFTSGDYEEQVFETVVLVSYDRGEVPPE